jgi:signal peptidase II
MNKITRFLTSPLLIVLVVLILDQWSKFWIKTNMFLGEEFPVLGDWFIIHFTENNGMAFGIEFGFEYGKLFLTLFRIVVVAIIGFYLFRLPRKTTSTGLLVTGALIFAGAVGNIIDSVLYGVIFDESYNQIATFLPESGGYAPVFYGKVVDMLYFPLIEGFFPDWLPIWGGEHFLFFRPVFNVADSAISVGIFSLLLFQRSFFKNLS